MKRIRRHHHQFGPSCNLDEDGDPIPPKWITTYEIETEAPGYWEEIDEDKARRLVDQGIAVIVQVGDSQ